MRHALPAWSGYLEERNNDAVAWQPWQPETLRQAKRRGKPIFLHIGYTTCTWCERMGFETFRHPAVTAYLNRYFVPVVVDRHCRPDLARAYQMPVVAMTGKTGWPLNVFLTPDLQPYHGGTYFPPQGAGVPGADALQQVLTEAARGWQEDRERVVDVAQEMARQMGEGLRPLLEQLPPASAPPGADALQAVQAEFDEQHGGFGGPPKFPQPLLLHWLLARGERGDAEARRMALTTLRAMAQGGIYDLVHGGFFAYTYDAAWQQPHFEKSLATNALLAQVYLRAYRQTGEALFREVAQATLGFLQSLVEPHCGLLGHGEGGLEEADTPDGRYHTWTAGDIDRVLPPALAEVARAAYGLDDEPRVLRQRAALPALAQQLGRCQGDVAQDLAEIRRRLAAARPARRAPQADRGARLGWNALAVQAFFAAAQTLNHPGYARLARRAYLALGQCFASDHGLAHHVFAGEARVPAFLDDLAAWARLHVVAQRDPAAALWPDGQPPLYRAVEVLELVEEHFAADWGYYDTLPDHHFPFGRPQTLLDAEAPAGNPWLIHLLLDLAEVADQPALAEKAGALLQRIAPLLAKHPTAFPSWLWAFERLSPAP